MDHTSTTYGPTRARPPSTVPWEALLFVLAAGGVALGFAAVGFWIASLRRQDGHGNVQDYPGLSPLNGLNGLNGLSDGAPVKAIPAFHFAQKKIMSRPNAGTDTYTVSTSPVRILSVSNFPGMRYVMIGSDQPLRMSTERAGFNTNRGIYILAGSTQNYGPYAPSVELWLVRGGLEDARVGVITELREA